jgi:hypothetical protein
MLSNIDGLSPARVKVTAALGAGASISKSRGDRMRT